MLRAVIYPRVSSLIQQDRHTIASQLHELPLFVERMGWQLVRPVDEFVDDGRSAKTGTLAHRLGFLRLLDELKSKPCPFDLIVVVDLDRIMRTESWRERGEILGSIQEAGVKIAVSSTGQLLDPNTSEGDLLLSFGSQQAAQDNRKRRTNSVRGKLEAIRQGRKPAGPTPFGFTYSREKRTWSHDEELAPIVIEIYKRIIDGESCEAIARSLQGRGIPRARPSQNTGPRKRKAGRWNRERVYGIVRNSIYRGQWLAHKTQNLIVKVSPIVDEETWWKADAVLSRHGKRGMRRTKHPYLIQELAVCSICGGDIGCTSSNSGARDRRKLWYYVCGRRRRPEGGKRCTLPMLRADEIDARVWSAIVETLSKPRFVESAIARQQEAREATTAWVTDLKAATDKLARYDERCEKMMGQFRRSLITEAAWERHLAAVEKERPMLARQVEAAQAGMSQAAVRKTEMGTLLDMTAKLRKRLVGADIGTRKELVRVLVPGGEYAVRLSADAIEMNLVLAAEREAPSRLPAFASG